MGAFRTTRRLGSNRRAEGFGTNRLQFARLGHLSRGESQALHRLPFVGASSLLVDEIKLDAQTRFPNPAGAHPNIVSLPVLTPKAENCS